MKTKIKLLVLIVMVCASFVRLWKLDTVPPHLTPDEAALGVNALLIANTGKDEHGISFPVVLESFGDYKPALYAYLSIPFIKVLGLTEVSVRLLSAVSGIAIVGLLAAITRQLFRKNVWLGVLVVAAVNPWLIYFSRGAWEANLSLALTLLGLLMFVRSFTHPKLLIVSFLSFGLTLFAYQGAKLSTPIVLVILFGVYNRQCMALVKLAPKVVVSAVAVTVIICLPIVFSFVEGKTGRLEVFSVFSYPRPASYLQNMLDEGGEKQGSVPYVLFHTETLNFARGVLGRWFNHFSPRFLFFEGDWQNLRHSSVYHGVMLLGDLVLLCVGLIFFIRKTSHPKLFFLIWLGLASLPAVLSRDQVQAVRALPMAAPMVVVCGYGLAKIVEYILSLSRTRMIIAGGLIVTGYLASIIYWSDSYFIHLPVHNARYWYWGYKQTVNALSPYLSADKPIFIQQSYDQPYIFFMFYRPDLYINTVAKYRTAGRDVGQVLQLNNLVFTDISWPTVDVNRKSLFVTDPNMVTTAQVKANPKTKLIEEVQYPDGNPRFVVFESL